ncbi:MAG: hypothetical protein QM763_14145 [Agriterribacter sp.]
MAERDFREEIGRGRELIVFVDHNNSGKSRLLKDILQLSTSDPHNTTILNNIDFTLPDSLEDFFKSYHLM